MKTALIQYTGNLQTRATHLASGAEVVTDPPVDNHGRGEAFSPTDLMCASLGSCMLTLMGIACMTHGIDMGFPKVEMLKVMASDPRRVSAIHLNVMMDQKILSSKERTILENAAKTCPVAKSIHPDIEVILTFDYPMEGEGSGS